MSICLCNLSADVILELAAQKKIEFVPASPDASEFSMDLGAVRQGLGELYDKLPKPIELLVGEPRHRRRSAEASAHVWRGSLPKGGVLTIGEGVYVSSPEFTLLQQANQLHQASLCQMLGRYLGTWTPKQGGLTGQEERAPLTSMEALRDFLLGLRKAKGKDNVRFAMAYTCEGAASAPETSLQLALCLPPGMHGFGLPQPTMNYGVDLSTEAQRLCSRQSIRIDLCWRDRKFGLEYQGQEHGNQLGEDYARWFAAREEGYELWFAAKEQLESAAQMTHIAREAARRIGADVDESRWPSEGEVQDLLDLLAGQRHPKPMKHDELRKCMALN